MDIKNNIKVLGIGSPFGDDQLAWKVLDLLQQNPHLQKYIPQPIFIEKLDRPGLHLLNLIQETRTVFLIDAVKTNTVPGTMHRLKNQEIESFNSQLLSSHGIGVGEALRLGRALNNLPQDIILYGIEISSQPSGFNISPKINRSIVQLAEQLANELNDLLILYRNDASC